MKALSVIGYHHTGKTTVVENIIGLLRQHNYTVSSIKDIHYQDFQPDKEGSNSFRHTQAGSEMVFARGLQDTAIFFNRQLSIEEMLQLVNSDFLIIEGMQELTLPKIVCADSIDQLDELVDDLTVAVSGKIADMIPDYKDLPIISSSSSTLLELTLNKAFKPLPMVDAKCCSECGATCHDLAVAIVKGIKHREDCCLDGKTGLSLTVDGKDIQIVPFVQNLLHDVCLSFIKNLKDIKEPKEIIIRIRED